MRLLLLCVLFACSGGSTTTGGTATGAPRTSTVTSEPDAATAAATHARVTVGQLVLPVASAVTRTTFEHFVVADFVRELVGAGPPCWGELERGVTATYQVQTPGPSSYFILEGDLPRPQVERCVPQTFAGKVDVEVKQDGELVVFDMGELGATYVAWRGRLVVVGERPQVVAALRATSDAGNPWPARIAQAGAAPVWAYRTDRLMESLFGASAQSYLVQLDRLATEPQPRFAGRAIIWYRSAGDAAVVARRARAGELAVQASPALGDTFRQMKVSHDGGRVTLAFDHTTFNLVDLDETLAMMSQWAAGSR